MGGGADRRIGSLARGGSPLPAVVLGGGSLLTLLAIFSAWVKFGRDRLPFTSLLAAPFYVLGKVSIYATFLFRRQQAWNRTERAAPAAQAARVGLEQNRLPVE